MLENLGSALDVQKWIDITIDVFLKSVKLPIQLWNQVPLWIKIPLYILVILFSAFMWWITLKHAYSRRHRY